MEISQIQNKSSYIIIIKVVKDECLLSFTIYNILVPRILQKLN